MMRWAALSQQLDGRLPADGLVSGGPSHLRSQVIPLSAACPACCRPHCSALTSNSLSDCHLKVLTALCIYRIQRHEQG